MSNLIKRVRQGEELNQPRSMKPCLIQKPRKTKCCPLGVAVLTIQLIIPKFIEFPVLSP